MAEHSQTNRQSIMSKAIDLLKKPLLSEWSHNMLPRGFLQHFKEAKDGENKTARLFLDAGFQAWLAYFLVTRKAQGGKTYPGQVKEKNLVSDLQQLSSPDRRTIANFLANIEVHPTVKSEIKNTLQPRAGEKNKLLASTESSAPTSPSTTPIMQPADKTHALVIEGTSNTASEAAPMLPSACSISTAGDMLDSIIESAPSEHMVSHPATERIASIFSQYLRGAIRIQDDTAVITFTFNSNFTYGVLRLAILPNKVCWLANKLFGANVEVEGESRYLVLANGCRLVPRPEITMEGAQGGALLEVFGECVTHGIDANKIRIQEAKQGLPASCVTMQLTGNAIDDAYLYVSLQWEEALQIYQVLF